MKYLLIPIGSIDENCLEDVFVAIQKFKDRRGLRVVVTPQVVWFQSKPYMEGLDLGGKTSSNS